MSDHILIKGGTAIFALVIPVGIAGAFSLLVYGK